MGNIYIFLSLVSHTYIFICTYILIHIYGNICLGYQRICMYSICVLIHIYIPMYVCILYVFSYIYISHTYIMYVCILYRIHTYIENIHIFSYIYISHTYIRIHIYYGVSTYIRIHIYYGVSHTYILVHMYCNTHGNTLQHTSTPLCLKNATPPMPAATHCNTLSHAATHCNTLQHTLSHTYVLYICMMSHTCIRIHKYSHRWYPIHIFSHIHVYGYV